MRPPTVKLMDLRAKREIHDGFGDALAKAFEMVVTPLVFGFFGYLLDRRLSTGPGFMIGLAAFVFGYHVWKFWGQYERDMQGHEARMGVRARRTEDRSP